jgi:signal transduction histidine kinase
VPGGYRLSSRSRRPSLVSHPCSRPYADVVGSPGLWVEFVRPASLSASGGLTQLSSTRPRTRRDRAVDAAACLIAAALGALFLSPTLRDPVQPLTSMQVVVDVACGAAACVALWWRRRWALGVALTCLLLGTFSSSATPAGLLALLSLAVHRPVRSSLLVTALWIPSLLLFAVYSPTTDPVTVLVQVTPLALAVTAWGMFIRARRQLLLTLRERALRAEADQRLHEDQARMAERTRIAREMHDVLAHRISLMALHAGGLEVRPDLPPAMVRETAELLRSTARQALEELRGVIGVLREEPGQESTTPVPLPTLSDIRRLVDESRQAGGRIDLDLRVEHPDAAPNSLGRDAYRIVQEALTNIRKHAGETTARVRITGAPGDGLHISVRNRQPIPVPTAPTLPGSGAGLLGLQERVTLAGGTLVHGADGSGDFVVEAELQW